MGINQKGFVNIIWVVAIVILAGAVGYFVFTKQQSQRGPITKETLATYQNKELGISFRYPSDLKVYQQDENSVLVKADYKNSEHSLVSIEMGIKKIYSQHETKEQFDSRFLGQFRSLRLLVPKIVKQETKGNYELLQVQLQVQQATESKHSIYYLLSDRGTFLIDDSLDMWRAIFEKEGIYQDYRTKLDAVRNSISIN